MPVVAVVKAKEAKVRILAAVGLVGIRGRASGMIREIWVAAIVAAL